VPDEVNTSHKWLQLPDEVVATYNAHDCLATARAAKAIKRILKANSQQDYWEREVWTLLPAVLNMQRRGLPYDTKLKGLYRKRLRKELGECDARLRELYRETADYTAELAEVARIEALVADPPEGKAGQKYRTRRTKGITLTKGEQEKLGRRLPDTWNPNSDDQVRAWLFGDLKLRPSTKTDGGKPSVDMDALGRIYRNLRKMDEHARPVLWDLMHRARLTQIDTQYLDPEVKHDTERETATSLGRGSLPSDGLLRYGGRGEGGGCESGGRVRETSGDIKGINSRSVRVYPTIKMTGTESQRFSVADPPAHSWPDEIRHLVRCADGYQITAADYSQIEARVFSIQTNDTHDLEVYRRYDANPQDKEWDIHYRTAAELFGYTVGELLSKPMEQVKGIRVYAKNFRYGVLLYGGGSTSTKAKVGCPCPKCAEKAPPTVDVSPADRRNHADRWFAQHPNVERWRNTINSQVRRTHALKGPMGQKWYFAAPWGKDVARQAWNRAIQGTAATIINRAMRALDALGCPLILQHHDALYSECLEGEVPKWAPMMKQVMELPVKELGERVFPVDLEAGPSWGELKVWSS